MARQKSRKGIGGAGVAGGLQRGQVEIKDMFLY